MGSIELLDCTLRDGAYVVNGEFGRNTIGGIIKRLQEANAEIIECGWLKDSEHKEGTSFFHIPSDLEQYLLVPKSKYSTYVAMIDYNRYDLSQLPECDGKSIEAIRIVFPQDKVDEGLALVKPIREKGYKVFLQAANTPGYTDAGLLSLVEKVNQEDVEALSIVDTFGTMYEEDLLRILSILNHNLRKSIGIGFHSHNNQQLSFALAMKFVNELNALGSRRCIIDSSLTGMGRGAGNTPTELICQYLNRRFGKDYNMNIIMDTIDIYMTQFVENYKWGYSIPHMIAGIFGCHVNNVAYLLQTHKTSSRDMRAIFQMLTEDERRHYDYDNLERVYVDYQSKKIDDSEAKRKLQQALKGKNIAAILPGRTAYDQMGQAHKYIKQNGAVTVGINAIVNGYNYDYLFFNNSMKLERARENNPDQFDRASVIITSNVDPGAEREFYVIDYDSLLKRDWKYYDNSLIMLLRFMSNILPNKVGLIGFDGFITEDRNKYADKMLENNLKEDELRLLHNDVQDMFQDFVRNNRKKIKVEFVTESVFSEMLNGH